MKLKAIFFVALGFGLIFNSAHAKNSYRLPSKEQIKARSRMPAGSSSRKLSDIIALLESMPASGYGTRSLCVKGDKIYGQYPKGHWSEGMVIATGTFSKFPDKTVKATPENINFGHEWPDGPEGWGRFLIVKEIPEISATYHLAPGTIDKSPADYCLFESKPVLE